MLDLSLFCDRTFAGANVLLVLSGFGIFGVYFFLSLYVQGILGFTPTKAGLVFVPMALLMTLIAPASNNIAARVGVGPTIAAGMLIARFGFIVLEHVGQSAGFTQLVPGVLIIGSGAGLTTPLTATVLSAIPAEKGGVASGVLNTVRELAASLGIAITGAILAARDTAAISSGATHAAGFVDGYHIGLYVSAGVMARGRRGRPDGAATQRAPGAGPGGRGRLRQSPVRRWAVAIATVERLADRSSRLVESPHA
jgi:MFS family permease